VARVRVASEPARAVLGLSSIATLVPFHVSTVRFTAPVRLTAMPASAESSVP
jgi:hypothetical protein